jgi:hypothetical protein
MAVDIILMQDPRRGLFLMSEVPLYPSRWIVVNYAFFLLLVVCPLAKPLYSKKPLEGKVQGYLAHNKHPSRKDHHRSPGTGLQ